MLRFEKGQFVNGGTFPLASCDLEAPNKREMWANEVETTSCCRCHGGASTVLPNIKLDGSLGDHGLGNFFAKVRDTGFMMSFKSVRGARAKGFSG